MKEPTVANGLIEDDTLPRVRGYKPMYPGDPWYDKIVEDTGLPLWVSKLGFTGSLDTPVSPDMFRSAVEQYRWLRLWIEDCFKMGLSAIEISALLGVPSYVWSTPAMHDLDRQKQYQRDPGAMKWDAWLRSLYDYGQSQYHKHLRKRTFRAEDRSFAPLFGMSQKTFFNVDLNDANSRSVSPVPLDGPSQQLRDLGPSERAALTAPKENEDTGYVFNPDDYLTDVDRAKETRKKEEEAAALPAPVNATKH